MFASNHQRLKSVHATKKIVLVVEISLQNFNNELSYNFYFATTQYIFLYKVKT